jgi:hypothetical protein
MSKQRDCVAAAIPDGAKRDDTLVIQGIVDMAHKENKAATIPPGIYNINPEIGISVPSNTHVTLSDGTILKSLPTTNGKYALIKFIGVQNSSLSGGKIIGDRNEHLSIDGQWGMGISIRGSTNILISNVQSSQCWGDGLYIGSLTRSGTKYPSKNITVRHFIASHNRRQGLSITGCIGAVISDSTFTYTNGTSPESGIDLEPNSGDIVKDITINNCTLTDNSGHGLVASRRSQDIRVTNCTIDSNKLNGVMLFGTNQILVSTNHIMNNGRYDVYVDKHSSHFSIEKNALSQSAQKSLLTRKGGIFIQKPL